MDEDEDYTCELSEEELFEFTEKLMENDENNCAKYFRYNFQERRCGEVWLLDARFRASACVLSRRSLWLCNVGLVLLQNTASALPPKEIVIQNNNKHVDFFVLHGSKSIFGAQFLHISIKNTVEGVCPGIFGAKLVPVFQYCCNTDLVSVTHVIFFTIRRSQRFTTRLRLEPRPKNTHPHPHI